jgi:hypothetical protein
MTLRFHKRLYTKAAVKDAVQAFTGVARVAVRAEGDYQVVDVEAMDPADTGEVAGELANWALGQSIVQRGER